MSRCRHCDNAFLHCHGTLVRHDDGAFECSEAACVGDAVLHEFVIECADVSPGCCTEPVQHHSRLAS